MTDHEQEPVPAGQERDEALRRIQRMLGQLALRAAGVVGGGSR